MRFSLLFCCTCFARFALLCRLGPVDMYSSPVDLGAVHVVDGGRGVLSRLKLDKGKATMFLRLKVHWQLHVNDVAKRDERRPDSRIGHFVGQSACNATKGVSWRGERAQGKPLPT